MLKALKAEQQQLQQKDTRRAYLVVHMEPMMASDVALCTILALGVPAEVSSRADLRLALRMRRRQ